MYIVRPEFFDEVVFYAKVDQGQHEVRVYSAIISFSISTTNFTIFAKKMVIFSLISKKDNPCFDDSHR